MNNKGWVGNYINILQQGDTVKFRPCGNSMTGRVESGQLCAVKPIISESTLKVNDVVLCQVGSQQFLHLIKKIKRDNYQIGNNKGCINGWVKFEHIYGILVDVE